ncbi:MAG: hypothetical protein Terrestrivirus1_315 [Terrestrivirus sp.]|uniref:Uncharacterized protein n=1 Tax=Terrestrivirus sp. TaxID=2487775 RepID=A0A3G4ZN88_9VIRU|nr:MAG: hypothetical protein Terrestrivirus1_315 [Terrestrivirus sp.]
MDCVFIENLNEPVPVLNKLIKFCKSDQVFGTSCVSSGELYRSNRYYVVCYDAENKKYKLMLYKWECDRSEEIKGSVNFYEKDGYIYYENTDIDEKCRYNTNFEFDENEISRFRYYVEEKNKVSFETIV